MPTRSAAPATTGTWSAPGRVNLIGEHTDYTGGFALPFALDRRTTVHGVRRSDALLRVHSDAYGEAIFPVSPARGEVTGWAAYVAGVAWALGEAGHRLTGAELRIHSDVPTGSGLSSSHSLEVATALALAGLNGIESTPAETARLVQRAENDYVGAATGVMDQLASLHGRVGHAVLLDTRTLTAEPIPFELESAGLALMVIDTRTPHSHAGGEYAARRASCHAAEDALGVTALREVTDADAAVAALPEAVTARRARHVITENDRVQRAVALMRGGRLRELGSLLTASHTSLRLDLEVSAERPDAAVAAALEGGALGARMVGGGFGGSVIALVDRDQRAHVEQAVRQRFESAGWPEPELLLTVPARGAGRDR